MFRPYSNLHFLSHLNNYDLVNKFNYKNFFIIPKYTKLSLKIFLKGALNSSFLNLYLKNFLLLYLYCFNVLSSKLVFKKLRRKKLKAYKVKLCLSYDVMKKKVLAFCFQIFFTIKKFSRPFYFANSPLHFSSISGKPKFFYSKLITFLPSLAILDHKEHRYFPLFKKSKIFLTFTLKNMSNNNFFNFFILKKNTNKECFKNFLLAWCFV